jgi:uncharacterized membrane protein YkvA (DUF1232 family)
MTLLNDISEKTLILFSAMRDKRTPWYAKVLVVLVLAYIISPIDIIPDFIPVIGLLDEAILVPIALVIIFKVIPDSVKQDQLQASIDEESRKKLMIVGVVLVVFIWASISILVLSLDFFDPVIAFFT